MNKILISGLAVALIIGLLAPFLASGNPDGLESAAEKIVNEHTLEQNLHEVGLKEEGTVAPSPMPDYAIEGMGKIGEIIAMVVGILIMAVLAYGVGMMFKK
ncbi:PDGLE domain-containing protein [Methanococcus aeolicus]|uniref:Cobalt transport protein CbiM n=1 Tax=Methanococcus aeolicus (strain ATCC BAA-1280 / DSM 17508 / OCM 812 / Nankai-3) TaxID=419665 RepID=A6UT59_META3|nr:PDGLE domain-containing protein [Methanococcus aeolicus]ABR55681.1 cobalt transport protein CbiM [Methanococcus aeolicus Nankai-3]UXM85180.1 PDGLE domain-containing protein [Methanococcus aeolicus]